MDNDNEPKKVKHSASIGRLSAVLSGEQYSGSPILDTSVQLEAGYLCWITWSDKEKFLEELNSIINKYCI
jgi:hypothetical protein